MNNGFIYLWRKLRDNPIYSNSKAVHIWVECLMRASYKGRKFYQGRDKVELEPGQFIMGYQEFGDSIDIPASTVHFWLKEFEKEGMVERKSNAKGTIVTIKNWDDYQNLERQMNANQTTNERKPNGNRTLDESYNKDNKDNFVKEGKEEDKSDSKSDKPLSEKYNQYAPTTANGLNYDAIKENWNEAVPEDLKIYQMTDKRKRKLRKRYKESSFSLQEIINAISEQEFLLGANDRGWVADFSWIIDSQENYTKVIERKYKDRKVSKKETILDSVAEWAEEQDRKEETNGQITS